MKLLTILALPLIALLTTHHTLVHGDTLTRSWCKCRSRDFYATADKFDYHSEHLDKTLSVTRLCWKPLRFMSRWQFCTEAAFMYKRFCHKPDGGEHELCYNHNFWGKDTVSLDGKTTVLAHRNMQNHADWDCTARCRKYWPNEVRMSSACNYTVGGVAVAPLSSNGCSTQTFTSLKDL